MNRRFSRAVVALAGLAGVLALTAGPASAAATFPVTTTLDGRTVKDPAVPVGPHRIADRYPTGTQVTIACQEDGPTYGGSTLWDLTSDGLWIPDGYVDAGHVAPACASPKSFPAKTDLNGRLHKGDAATAPGAVVDKYKTGKPVPVDCQAVVGTAIWDHTADQLWVPDTYVKTGSDGFVAGLPRCDVDEYTSVVHGRSNGPAGPTTGTRAEKVARVLAAARSQVGLGLNYSWGAGGKGGPSYGIHHFPDGDPTQGDDYGRRGFDCSGLTLYAFWVGAGLDIGDWTGLQYAGGTKVPLTALQPGDLVFWGTGDDADTTTHVVLYLGDNQVIEAAPPRDGHSVHVTALYGSTRWMAHAIRYL